MSSDFLKVFKFFYSNIQPTKANAGCLYSIIGFILLFFVGDYSNIQPIKFKYLNIFGFILLFFPQNYSNIKP